MTAGSTPDNFSPPMPSQKPAGRLEASGKAEQDDANQADGGKLTAQRRQQHSGISGQFDLLRESNRGS